MRDHTYATELTWSGTTGDGYRGYSRAHTVTVAGADLAVSADPAFRGDADLANPEQLLLAAASSCQLLSFLAVAAREGVDVVDYADSARAVMPLGAKPMRITEITLNVRVSVRGADEAAVCRLLEQAHEECFIANTISATIDVAADVTVLADDQNAEGVGPSA